MEKIVQNSPFKSDGLVYIVARHWALTKWLRLWKVKSMNIAQAGQIFCVNTYQPPGRAHFPAFFTAWMGHWGILKSLRAMCEISFLILLLFLWNLGKVI